MPHPAGPLLSGLRIKNDDQWRIISQIYIEV